MRLVVLIGSSGSGKTYFANKLKEEHEDWVLISPDEFRLKKHGRINFLYKPFSTFSTVDEMVFRALKSGKTVIYDACNLTRFRRSCLFRRLSLSRMNVEVIGVVFNTRFLLCVEQDKSKLRLHHVGKYVILIMKVLSYLNTPKMIEGFDVLVTPETFSKAIGGS